MRFDRGANVRFHFACVLVSNPLLLQARQSCRDISLPTRMATEDVMRADEMVTAFLELEAAIRAATQIP